jgi:hypothetical protein
MKTFQTEAKHEKHEKHAELHACQHLTLLDLLRTGWPLKFTSQIPGVFQVIFKKFQVQF